jgi:hypothetical protein
MDDNDDLAYNEDDSDEIEIEYGEDLPEESASSGGAGFLSKHLKVLVALLFVSVVLAVGTAYLMFRDREDAGPTLEDMLVEDSGPVIPLARIEQIRERRSRMRTEHRSSHNQYLTTKIEENAIADITDRGDLVVVAGIFNNYVEALSILFEMGRIITNNYLSSQQEVWVIFENELMPKYKYAERRRKQLRPRIRSSKFLPMLDELDYIALHDSIAVSSMAAYLRNEKSEDLTKAIDYAYQSKLMKKDFWDQFSYFLKRYKIEFVRNEKIWRRYFGYWDEVEP